MISHRFESALQKGAYMKRFGTVILISVLLLTVLTGNTACGAEEPDLPAEEIPTVYTIDNERAPWDYGDYTYQVYSGVLYRYNRVTNVRSIACPDPACDGTCPLHKLKPSAISIYGDRLVFTGIDRKTDPYSGIQTETTFFGYMDLKLGDVHLIRECNEYEATGIKIRIYEDYFYYVVNLLKEGGDALSASDYHPTLCRMKIGSDIEERVMPLYSKNEGILSIRHGKIVTLCDSELYTYDLAGGSRQRLGDFEKEGYSTKPIWYDFIGTKMYFYVRDGKNSFQKHEKYKDVYYYKQALLMIDIETGEWKRITSDPVASCFVTKDAIYYTRSLFRTLYEPTDGTGKPVVLTSSAELYACDLDGSNERVVYRNEGMQLSSLEATVIDQVYYGNVIIYNEETHKMNGLFFRKIDFKTGEITAPHNDFEE